MAPHMFKLATVGNKVGGTHHKVAPKVNLKSLETEQIKLMTIKYFKHFD